MKKLLSTTILLFSLLVISHSNVFAQQHTPTKLGLGVVYGSEIEAAGIQGNATFRVSPRVAIAPDISIFFPDEDTPGFVDSFVGLNLNGHYIFDASDQYHIYGLGGLNVSVLDYDGNRDSNSELGINLGLGGEYHLNKFSLFGELKYVVSDFDEVVLGVGARFPLN